MISYHVYQFYDLYISLYEQISTKNELNKTVRKITWVNYIRAK